MFIMPNGLPRAKSDLAEQAGTMPIWMRKSRRITITVPESIYEHLANRSDQEGRSIPNLAAFLLEQAIIHERHRFAGTADHADQHRQAA